MALDQTQERTDLDYIHNQLGETVTINRLSLDYNSVPPSETWSSAGTITMEIQPLSGAMARRDPGLAAISSHQGFAAYDSGLVVNDRVIRSGDTNYYLVVRVDDYGSHLEAWLQYCKGAA